MLVVKTQNFMPEKHLRHRWVPYLQKQRMISIFDFWNNRQANIRQTSWFPEHVSRQLNRYVQKNGNFTSTSSRMVKSDFAVIQQRWPAKFYDLRRQEWNSNFSRAHKNHAVPQHLLSRLIAWLTLAYYGTKMCIAHLLTTRCAMRTRRLVTLGSLCRLIDWFEQVKKDIFVNKSSRFRKYFPADSVSAVVYSHFENLFINCSHFQIIYRGKKC